MRREESSEIDIEKALCEISVPLRLCGYLFTLRTRMLAQSQLLGADDLDSAARVRGSKSRIQDQLRPALFRASLPCGWRGRL